MDIEKTNGYGIAISDLEGSWDKTFKKKIKKTSRKIIFGKLSFVEKTKLFIVFLKRRIKAARLDLSDIKARGMTNSSFIKQQLDYIAMYSALSKVAGKDRAKEIMFNVMEETSVEAFAKSSPEPAAIREYGDSFEFFRKYLRPLPGACAKAGCLDIRLAENNERCFQFDIHWCVWLELAKKMDVPEACMPNCYADDCAYPKYFEAYGIKYSRTGTLAAGSERCDLRFEKII